MVTTEIYYNDTVTPADAQVSGAAFHPETGYNDTVTPTDTPRYTEITVPAICLCIVAIVAGLGNLGTVASFATNWRLRSNPLNWLVLAMAGYDVTLCSIVAPLDLYEIVGLARGLDTVLSWHMCLGKHVVHMVTVVGSISMLAALAVLRLYAVLRRHGGAQVPKTAVVTAIVMSALLAVATAATVVNDVTKGRNVPWIFQACYPAGQGVQEISRFGPATLANIFIIALSVVGLASYFLQYICLRYNFPAASPGAVASATQHVYVQWEIASARVGAVATVTYLLSYVPWTIVISTVSPSDSAGIPSLYLGISFGFIQAWTNPLLYLLTTPMYRAAVKVAITTCRQTTGDVAPMELETNHAMSAGAVYMVDAPQAASRF